MAKSTEQEGHSPITQAEYQKIRQLILGFPFTSGLRIAEVEGNKFGLHPPMQRRSAMQMVGGVGVTNRDMEMMEQACPGVSERVSAESGKIVVIGNGFSTLGTTVADRYAAGDLTKQPVVVELFDYSAAEHDFATLKEQSQNAGVYFPFETVLSRAAATAHAVRTRLVDSVTYLVGSGKPPSSLMDASLVINIHGASLKATDEQLTMLAPGGVLLTTDSLMDRRLQRQFSATYRRTKTGKFTSVVKRASS
jgi:hypothetical protein